MLIVGLTGGIGSGKSTVAKVFEKLGIPVYTADEHAKELMLTDEVKDQIIDAFGEDSYSDGELNRTFLADKVFKDEDALSKLNSIVHPAVRRHHKSWTKEQDAPYTIREAAILYESGSHKDCDFVISVTAPEELRLERVVKRDDADVDQVRSRMKNQWSQEKKDKLADFVIINDGDQMILPQIIEIHKELMLRSE